MRTLWTTLTSLLLVALLTASCQKITSGPLPVEKMAFNNAIPLQYGELVAVSQSATGQFTLWFVKPDKTIVAVGVDGARGTVAPQALTIPRR